MVSGGVYMELVPPRDRKKLLNRIVSNTPGPVPLKGAIDALMSGNLGELFVDVDEFAEHP